MNIEIFIISKIELFYTLHGAQSYKVKHSPP